MSETGKRVLIVQSEKALVHVLELKLKHEGFETEVAYDGEEALRLLNSSEYDIVLLDLMLPVVDGFQVLETMQGFDHKPIVLVFTNLSQREDEERALTLGAHNYFIRGNTPLAMLIDEIRKM